MVTHTPGGARGHRTHFRCALLLPAWVRASPRRPRPRVSFLTCSWQKTLSAPAEQSAPARQMKWAKEGKNKNKQTHPKASSGAGRSRGKVPAAGPAGTEPAARPGGPAQVCPGAAAEPRPSAGRVWKAQPGPGGRQPGGGRAGRARGHRAGGAGAPLVPQPRSLREEPARHGRALTGHLQQPLLPPSPSALVDLQGFARCSVFGSSPSPLFVFSSPQGGSPLVAQVTSS